MKMMVTAGLVALGEDLMMTSSGLMPPSDRLCRTNDTQTHIHEHTHTLTHMHVHTLGFPVTLLIWHAICAGWVLFEIRTNTALQHRQCKNILPSTALILI